MSSGLISNRASALVEMSLSESMVEAATLSWFNQLPYANTVAFDVYGTLINTSGVVVKLEKQIGDKAPRVLADLAGKTA